jgi:hypothetical protein
VEATVDELIGQVAQKTGLPADRARTAVETVLGFLKGKLPAAIGSQLDQVVGGTPSGLGDVAGKALGGLMGK